MYGKSPGTVSYHGVSTVFQKSHNNVEQPSAAGYMYGCLTYNGNTYMTNELATVKGLFGYK